jgi:hypothetical protein
MRIQEIFSQIENDVKESPEVTIGDYTTTHFYMCGSAIETAKKHSDKPGMEDLIRLQDMVYKLEKQVMDAGEATSEAKDFAKELHDAVMDQAKKIGIEEEVADYQEDHLNSIIKGDPKPGFGRVDIEENWEITAEGTRCWKGYKRKGFKTMFGKRVPNCVKREGKYFVNDAFGDVVFESIEKENALNFLRQNYLELKACAIHDNISESSHAGLRAWFGKGKKGGAGGGGWDRYNTKGERIGKCGDRGKGEGKTKCLSKARAASLRSSGGKKAIAAAVRRKRKKDKNPERRGKAINVSNKRKKK